jgi:hypothetical protein
MAEVVFDFNKRFTPKRKQEFAVVLQDLQGLTRGLKVSSRGWGYILEQAGYISKNQFDRVQDAINDLRRQGILPVDFVAEDENRMFSGVINPSTYSLESLVKWQIGRVTEGYNHYTPDYWKDEEYYVQCIVEKVDVRNLFEPVCAEYYIPIANAKGWSSISQRAEFARRFKEAEQDGKKCVLLYCGDHDPDGLRISDQLRKNLEQIKDVTWADGMEGYDPEDLIIDRFGLQYDFIIRNKFVWIDNLITGNTSKHMDLSNKSHPNHNLPYVQQYLKKVGCRKCEANVLITKPEAAEDLIRAAIGKYLDSDIKDRFREKDQAVKDGYDESLDSMSVKFKKARKEISVRESINLAAEI